MVMLRMILLSIYLFIKFLYKIMPRKKTITYGPIPKQDRGKSNSQAVPMGPQFGVLAIIFGITVYALDTWASPKTSIGASYMM